jgi:hypothetical protein
VQEKSLGKDHPSTVHNMVQMIGKVALGGVFVFVFV